MSSKRAHGARLLLTLLLPVVAGAAGPNTDTAIWRATNGLVLGLARAGSRIVAVGSNGHILLSDDEGASWRLTKSPTDVLLTSVVFATPSEGWAVGQDETILHTTDAGQSWTGQYFKKDADQTLFTIISLAPGHLFASGAYNVTLETQDGTHWTEGKIPATEDDYHLNCAINRGNDILVTGEGGHAFIRYAGAWTPMKLPYDGSQFGCALGADGSFYSFGLRGTAFRALPGAQTWTKLDSNTQRSFFGATNLANGMIAVVGSNGLLDILDPATNKMRELPSPNPDTLSAVLAAHGGKLIVAGDDGVQVVDPSAAAEGAVSQ